MFSPKILKFLVTGTVSALLLVTAGIGASHFLGGAGADTEDPAQVTIDELTEVDVQQWCSLCQKRLYPLAPHEYEMWRGKTREQLEAVLAKQFPGANVLAFEPTLVVVRFPAVSCPECSALRWPKRGYIGLTQDNAMAIFAEDGSLYEVYGEAPGAAMELLREGIPFESPEECEQWLINLTS